MKNKYCFLIFFYFICSQSFSAVRIDSGFKSIHPGREVSFLVEDSVLLSAEEAFLSARRFKPLRFNHFSAGLLRHPVWLLFTIDARYNQDLLLEIEFQDINLVDFYHFADDSLMHRYHTGDYYPFRNRPFYARNFVFPFKVDVKQKHTVLVKINAHGEPLVVPLKLWNRKVFYEYLQEESYFFGIYFSVIISYFLLGCIVFYVMRTRLNLYYLIYLICVFFFLFSTKGLAYQYLWPESTFIKNIADPFLIGAMAGTSLIFAGEFLQLKMNNIGLYRILHYFAGFSLIFTSFVPVFMSLPERWMHTIQDIYLLTIIFDAVFALVLAFISLRWRRSSRVIAYFVAFSIVSIGFIIYYLQFYAILPHTFFTRNIIFINAFIEFSIFTAFLTHIVYKRDKERSIIQNELIKQRERVALAVLEGEEAERQRLSRELHDGLGLWLAVLKNRMSGLIDEHKLTIIDYRFTSLLDDLETACSDVRNISYNLSPYSLQRAGLLAAAEDLILKLNTLKGKTRYTFSSEVNAPVPSGSHARIAYRIIQELIHNAHKYAEAANVNLMLISNNDSLIIRVHDDGRGFNPADDSKSGTGLKNISRRLELISGTLNIRTEKGAGTMITAVLYL